jgi:hypothetical protein
MPRRRPVVLTTVVASAALALLAAGCGGGRSAGVASVASATASTMTTQDAQGALLAFSRCMRSHGMPSFPDPQQFVGGSVKLTIHQTGADSSPHFRTAMRACNRLLPSRGGSQETAQQTRTQLADMLSFARCMRSHGVTRFPDPRPQGGLSVEMVQAAGIDVHSPAVLRVVQTCLPASHGALTPAMVDEALGKAGG